MVYTHHCKEFGLEPVHHFVVVPLKSTLVSRLSHSLNVTGWLAGWLACASFSLRLSSEDGEEASAYFYESDDSVETRVKTPYSGEMDLLGEILDTLSTHSSDQGKLAAAKSLDFFRSMDDIDYKPTVS